MIYFDAILYVHIYVQSLNIDCTYLCTITQKRYVYVYISKKMYMYHFWGTSKIQISIKIKVWLSVSNEISISTLVSTLSESTHYYIIYIECWVNRHFDN